MRRQDVMALLEKIASGESTPVEAMRVVEQETYRELGFAKPDHQRARRLGFPETVLAQGKKPDHLVAICKDLLKSNSRLLVTRLDEGPQETLTAAVPGGQYNTTARTLSYGLQHARQNGLVLVLCAGTSDLPVAEEAMETARIMNSRVELIADVGVAGIHRLLDYEQRLAEARVLVVVAGMEGALPSVVGGLAAAPLIAVPTSVGYGASLGGVAALLAMLNSCAPGVTVVNIDNGFGAGYSAALINNLSQGE